MDGLDTHQASQNSGRFATQLVKLELSSIVQKSGMDEVEISQMVKRASRVFCGSTLPTRLATLVVEHAGGVRHQRGMLDELDGVRGKEMSQQVLQVGGISRENLVKRGQRLEYFTILWNSLEGLIAIATGLLAGSVALVGFGFDSLIENRASADRE